MGKTILLKDLIGILGNTPIEVYDAEGQVKFQPEEVMDCEVKKLRAGYEDCQINVYAAHIIAEKEKAYRRLSLDEAREFYTQHKLILTAEEGRTPLIGMQIATTYYKSLDDILASMTPSFREKVVFWTKDE